MLRIIAAVSALGVLALVLVVSFIGGDDPAETLVNKNTGEPLTLESVQKDVEWHRETAKKLQETN